MGENDRYLPGGTSGQMPQFDVEKFVRTLKKYKKHIISAIVLILVLIGVASSYFTVNTNEEAAILRFGKYLETAGPGLHLKIPFGVDKPLTREIKTIYKQEFGFRTVTAGVESTFDYDSFGAKEVSLMLTGDLNCAEVNWVVRYKIRDLRDYLFNVRNVEGTIRDASEAVMRRIVGDSSIDEILMIRRKEIQDLALTGIEQLLAQYGCGIDVQAVKLKRVDPPKEVKDAFDAVNQARQVRDQIINEAEAAKNRELIPAEGRKNKTIDQAKGYREQRVKEAQGNARAFLAVLEEYDKAKDITRRRLYLETMAKVLPKCGKIYLIDEEQKGILPLLKLGEEQK